MVHLSYVYIQRRGLNDLLVARDLNLQDPEVIEESQRFTDWLCRHMELWKGFHDEVRPGIRGIQH
jgi:hypothetical protein